MRRLGSPSVAPDGRLAAYQVRETDLAANKGITRLWLLDLSRKGAVPVRVAGPAAANQHDARFSADGRWLYFFSNTSGIDQL